MRQLLLVLICISLAGSIHAQASVQDSLKKHYLKMYGQALQYNDVNTAINALHGYIAVDNNIFYKDTLSMLYFSGGSYLSSLMLADEVQQAIPSNARALARVAECYRNLGDAKKAIDAYEKVVPVLKEPYYYYQLASSQYQLKRLGECETNLQRVIADTNSSRTAVNFTMEDGRVQQVPAHAAAHNFLGIIKLESNDLATAKKHLQQAVQLYPDFLGAKQNLQLCESKMKPAKSAPVTKPKQKG
ncbi:MAG TPA: tetratricopeptide repeat protein [Chitinophagaceae bacterium]|nr:tetratricopeptide repeat protein [Chitinophagaceae bacterium]